MTNRTKARAGGAVVTDRNANALVEAFTAVELVRATGLAAAAVAREALQASTTPTGRRLRVPPVSVRDDLAGGRVVMLAGLALTEDLVVGLAGRAFERTTRELVDDPDVPGELTGALVALLGDLRVNAARRVGEHLGRVKPLMADAAKRSRG